MLGSSDHETYRNFVQRLMQCGWYRVGQGPAHDPDRVMWGFREGHVVDRPTSATLWIPAGDEISAMRILLGEIEQLRGNGEGPGTARGWLASVTPLHPHRKHTVSARNRTTV
jgi:hypothetical protein